MEVRKKTEEKKNKRFKSERKKDERSEEIESWKENYTQNEWEKN